MDIQINSRIALCLLLLIFLTNLKAQFSVNIGNDTTYCINESWNTKSDTFYISDKININGGTSPFTYKWSTKVILTENLTFYASFFLNDTSILKPFFINAYFNNENISFYLQVEDSQGEIASDSINIKFSQFAYHQTYFIEEIEKGDTLQFTGHPFIGAGIPPLTYTWQPDYALSDNYDLSAYAFPDTTTNYYIYAEDSVGCKSNSVLGYRVIVPPSTAIHGNKYSKQLFKFRQTSEKIIIEANVNIKNNYAIRIYDLSGKLLLFDQIESDEFIISNTLTNTPLIFINIYKKNKIVYSKKALFN